VTETALIRDPDRTIEQLSDLRDLGVRIALDDFGTGYSSLSYLHRLPVDILKIARPFIADVANDETFVRTMIDLGKNLGLTVVAEGVETEEQRLRVAELGCDLAQGYLFGRPGTLTDLLALMSNDRV
ncbi:MAG: EAL domain-containing protein, partial [Acidimicrobiales bacterium]|nr:EAL domain-containing protein [Acidimicrobiales bacterium]